MTGILGSVNSILGLDCGSVFTRAHLFGRVEGHFRFIGQGAALSPVGVSGHDLADSVQKALVSLSGVMNRRLLDARGDIIRPEYQGDGVDAVVTSISAAKPLRVVLACSADDGSQAAAETALAGTSSLVECIYSKDGRDSTEDPQEYLDDQMRFVRERKPDLVLIVGGKDGGICEPVLRAVEVVVRAYSPLPRDHRPAVLYAGNAACWARVLETVKGTAELRRVDNILPSSSAKSPAALREEIDALYLRWKVAQMPGSGRLAAWSSGPMVPAARAYASSLEQIARAHGISVLGVDLGGARTMLASVVDGETEGPAVPLCATIDLGLGVNVDQLLDRVPLSSLQRWLPFGVDAAEVSAALRYKATHPRTLPKTDWDFLLEQAVAREILRMGMRTRIGMRTRMGMRARTGMHSRTQVRTRTPTRTRARDDSRTAMHERLPSLGARNQQASAASHDPSYELVDYDLIVGGGGVLAQAPSRAQAALVLVDAIEPVGVTGLALDQNSLLVPLGAVGMAEPVGAEQILERDGLLSLGTVIAPEGDGREGEVALSCTISFGNGQTLSIEVPVGSVRTIPLGHGQVADLELRPGKRFDLGLGAKGQACATRVMGGAVGIILDARGRPLPLGADAAEQRQKIEGWLRAAGC